MTHDCNCHGGSDHRLATIVPGTIERPLYAPGLILQDRDLTAAVDYTRDLNRLLFRTLFGCGVICGLKVSIRDKCNLVVTVDPGLALDGCGDPLHLPGSAVITLEERDGVVVPEGSTDGPRNRQFWIIACAKDRRCEPRPTICDDSLDDTTQATRARMATEISVTFDPPKCACGCLDFDAIGDDANREELIARLRARSNPPPNGNGDNGGDGGGDGDGYQPAQPVNQPCYDSHTKGECPDDCGCGSACSSGCCVLLGWAIWSSEGWQVFHYGVRRFVRPVLLADPIAR